MKRLFFNVFILLLAANAWGQQLSIGVTDNVRTNESLDHGYTIESDGNEFYWIAGSDYTIIEHDLLQEVYNDFANIFFIKYDAKGIPIFSNYLRGATKPNSVFSYEGGLKMLVSTDKYIEANNTDGRRIDLDVNANKIEVLANYDRQGVLKELVKIWRLNPSEYPDSRAALDRNDGSIYVYGINSTPLEIEGPGITIGSDWWDDYFYILKFDRNLNFEWEFTAGFTPGTIEVGSITNVEVFPLNNGEIFVSGGYMAMGSGPQIADESLPDVGDQIGVFGFLMKAIKEKVWLQKGVAGIHNTNQFPRIYDVTPMSNGDIVLAGITTTGIFQTEQIDVAIDGGQDFLNQFVVRIGPGGAHKWTLPFPSMVFQGGEEVKKGVTRESSTTGTDSNGLQRVIEFDAIDVNQEVLYLAGRFQNDAFLVDNRALPKPRPEGVFVASIDLEQGSANWGYSISSDWIEINGIDCDQSGNVVILGKSGGNQELEGLAPVSMTGKELIYHLGLNYNGVPMWFNNAYLQQNSFGLDGIDVVVLPNGEVFSSMSLWNTDNLELGDSSLFADYTETNWLVAMRSDMEFHGTVKDVDGNPVYPGYVKAIKSAVSGRYPEVDSVELSTDGTFHFAGLFPGNYTLQVLADPGNYPGALRTYQGNKTSWEVADYGDYGPQDLVGGMDIILEVVKELTPEDGSGSISGNLGYEDEEDGALKGTMGRPVDKGSVLLTKKTKKSTSAGEVIAYVETDEFGNFQFTNVPDGDYTLIIDIPGLEMLETHDVTIVGDRIVAGLVYTVG